MIAESLELAVAAYSNHSAVFNKILHILCVFWKYMFFGHEPAFTHAARFAGKFFIRKEVLHLGIVIWILGFPKIIFCPGPAIRNKQCWCYDHLCFCDCSKNITVQRIDR